MWHLWGVKKIETPWKLRTSREVKNFQRSQELPEKFLLLAEMGGKFSSVDFLDEGNFKEFKTGGESHYINGARYRRFNTESKINIHFSSNGMKIYVDGQPLSYDIEATLYDSVLTEVTYPIWDDNSDAAQMKPSSVGWCLTTKMEMVIS